MTDEVFLTGDEPLIVDVKDIFVSCLERKIPDEIGDVAHRSFVVDSVETMERKGIGIFTSHGDEIFFFCLLQESLLEIFGSAIEPYLLVLFDQ